jgi:hypothetical protein
MYAKTAEIIGEPTHVYQNVSHQNRKLSNFVHSNRKVISCEDTSLSADLFECRTIGASTVDSQSRLATALRDV